MLRRHFALGALLAVCATLLTQRPADAGCGPLGGLCDTVNDNVIKPAGDKVVDPAKSAFVSGANWAADRGKDAGNAMKDGASYVASGDWAKAAAKLGESARNSVLEAIGNGVKTLKNTGVSIGKLAREGVQSALKEAAKHKDLLRYASVASNLAKDAWKAGKNAAGLANALLTGCLDVVRDAARLLEKKGQDASQDELDDATKKSAHACSEAAKKAWLATLELAKKGAEFAMKYLNEAKQGLDVALKAIDSVATEAWKALSSLGDFVYDLILDLSSKAIGAIVSPLSSAKYASLERGARRDAAAACFSAGQVGAKIAAAFRTVLAAGISQLNTGALTNAWARFSHLPQMTAYAKDPSKYPFPKTLPPDASEATSDIIKRRAKSLGSNLGVMGVTAALSVVDFTLNYLNAGATCYPWSSKKNEAEYKACYTKAFVDFSKTWAWDSITTVALAPLDYTVITPIAIEIGTAVSAVVAAAIAAATAGVGALAAPAIGAIVTILVKLGLSVAIDLGLRAGFYNQKTNPMDYTHHSWPKMQPFFEKTLIGDAPEKFWQTVPRSVRK